MNADSRCAVARSGQWRDARGGYTPGNIVRRHRHCGETGRATSGGRRPAQAEPAGLSLPAPLTYPPQAQPTPLVQVSDLAMQVSPQGLPSEQTLQHEPSLPQALSAGTAPATAIGNMQVARMSHAKGLMSPRFSSHCFVGYNLQP